MDDVDLNAWHLLHPQEREIVEVALFRSVVFDGDSALQRSREAKKIALCTWASMLRGLTAMPQSTAQTTRRAFTLPVAATDTSATKAIIEFWR